MFCREILFNTRKRLWNLLRCILTSGPKVISTFLSYFLFHGSYFFIHIFCSHFLLFNFHLIYFFLLSLHYFCSYSLFSVSIFFSTTFIKFISSYYLYISVAASLNSRFSKVRISLFHNEKAFLY